MRAALEPWFLPSALSFLDEIEAAHDEGLAVIGMDEAMPAGWEDAMIARLRTRPQEMVEIEVSGDGLPAETVAGPFGCTPSMEDFTAARRSGTTLLLRFCTLDPSSCAAWRTFLSRFRKAREEASTGMSLVVAEADPAVLLAQGPHRVVWGDRVRRLDVAIWADMHAPPNRPEPLAALAAALAVEVCAWRLDLAAEIVRAARGDLCDPIGWLRRREGAPCGGTRRFGGADLGCPLAVLQSGDVSEIQRRIWRAQLSALFPWLEERRLDAIDRHRRMLVVDDHLRALGVGTVEEIELGAIAWQLARRVPPGEATRLLTLARIRNALAHRKPATPDDLHLILSASSQR